MLLVLVASLGVSAGAEETRSAVPTAGTRIHQTDAYGRVRHNQPSWVVKENGQIIEVSPYGSEQPQKQQYKVEGNRVYHADFAGRVQHHKPSYTIGKNGQVIQNDAYGRPQYHEPQYAVKGSKVYAADRYGRPRQQAFKLEKKAAPKPKP